jgi:hypothetical protein
MVTKRKSTGKKKRGKRNVRKAKKKKNMEPNSQCREMLESVCTLQFGHKMSLERVGGSRNKRLAVLVTGETYGSCNPYIQSGPKVTPRAWQAVFEEYIYCISYHISECCA